MKILRLCMLLSLLPAVGCLKMDQTLSLRKDGSGTFHLSYSVPEQSIVKMKAMLKLRDEMARISGNTGQQANDFPNVFIDPSIDDINREAKKYEQYGITLETVNVVSRNGWRQVEIKAHFPDLSKLAKADFFPRYGFSLVRTKNGEYILHHASEGEDFISLQPTPDPQTEEMLTPLLAGFNVTLRVDTPGRVIKANGDRQSLYGVVWVFNFDQDVNALSRLQNQDLMILFDGSGIRLPEIQQRPGSLPPDLPF